MTSIAFRSRVKGAAILHALGRAFSIGLGVKAPLSKAQEKQAAANYWRMLGHDLSLEERAERHHKFATDAPYVRPQRHRTTA
jgi:hypothetical protein